MPRGSLSKKKTAHLYIYNLYLTVQFLFFFLDLLYLGTFFWATSRLFASVKFSPPEGGCAPCDQGTGLGFHPPSVKGDAWLVEKTAAFWSNKKKRKNTICKKENRCIV